MLYTKLVYGEIHEIRNWGKVRGELAIMYPGRLTD